MATVGAEDAQISYYCKSLRALKETFPVILSTYMPNVIVGKQYWLSQSFLFVLCLNTSLAFFQNGRSESLGL